MKNRLLLACVLVTGCTQPERPTTPLTLPRQAEAARITNETPIELLSRGLAIAMTSPGIRDQLFQDLRDSPFEHHRVHFRSYLAGSRAATLAPAIAQVL